MILSMAMALVLQTTVLIDKSTPQWPTIKEPKTIMVIPFRDDQYTAAPFFERRANGDRCMLFYTFSEDIENWERIAWCSTVEPLWCSPALSSLPLPVECTTTWTSDSTMYMRCPGDSKACIGMAKFSNRVVRGPILECEGKGCEP